MDGREAGAATQNIPVDLIDVASSRARRRHGIGWSSCWKRFAR